MAFAAHSNPKGSQRARLRPFHGRLRDMPLGPVVSSLSAPRPPAKGFDPFGIQWPWLADPHTTELAGSFVRSLPAPIFALLSFHPAFAERNWCVMRTARGGCTSDAQVLREKPWFLRGAWANI
jgi:hypothetical protein